MTLKHPRQLMPDFVKSKLEAGVLTTAYDARPAYQRNDYLWWINDAKRDATKRRRLAKAIQGLEAGSGYLGMSWLPRAKKRGHVKDGKEREMIAR